MKLPELESPEKFVGLYVFEFSDQVAVGYTAQEIAILLESEEYANGKVYRIHRALPDGTIELQGVPAQKFHTEDGMFFYRPHLSQAQADFDALSGLVSETPPPCRMKAQLAKLHAEEPLFVTAIIFPAESTHDVANWLFSVGYEGGDRVEGGISQVTDYYAAQPVVIHRQQWWPAKDDSRPAGEVLATTRLAIQRQPA